MRRILLIAAALLALTAGVVFRDLSAAEIPKHRAASANVDPQVIKAEIRDILADPEYNRGFKHKPTVWERVVAWFGRILERFFDWLGGPLSLGGGVGKIVSWVLAMVVIALFVTLFVLGAMRFSARCRGRGGGEEAADDWTSAPASSSRLMKEAAELAKSGDYRGAFLRAYLASIVYLDEIDALRFQRSKTNWEYLRDLQGKGLPAYADDLLPLTRSFDRKFYGGETSTGADYDTARQVFDTLKQRAAA